MKTRIAAALALVGIAIPAAAQTPISVGRFDGVTLVGGGDIVIRHGAAHKVTLLKGNAQLAGFDVEDGGLVIRSCRRSCTNNRLKVEIVTPSLEAVAIRGGGTILAEGFGPRPSFAASIHGGGTIDVDDVPADSVTTSIHGGGTIRTDARRSLVASINGGGTITYLSDPRTTVSINGGGRVTRAGGTPRR